jgi:hypothetical protein
MAAPVTESLPCSPKATIQSAMNAATRLQIDPSVSAAQSMKRRGTMHIYAFRGKQQRGNHEVSFAFEKLRLFAAAGVSGPHSCRVPPCPASFMCGYSNLCAFIGSVIRWLLSMLVADMADKSREQMAMKQFRMVSLRRRCLPHLCLTLCSSEAEAAKQSSHLERITPAR